MEQCQRCNELWLAFAKATAELAEAWKSREDCGDDCQVAWAGRWYWASAEREAAQTKLKIHLALAHPDDIGRGAMAGVIEFMPLASRRWMSSE